MTDTPGSSGFFFRIALHGSTARALAPVAHSDDSDDGGGLVILSVTSEAGYKSIAKSHPEVNVLEISGSGTSEGAVQRLRNVAEGVGHRVDIGNWPH